jgi:hypothetical protein
MGGADLSFEGLEPPHFNQNENLHKLLRYLMTFLFFSLNRLFKVFDHTFVWLCFLSSPLWKKSLIKTNQKNLELLLILLTHQIMLI